MLNPIIGAHHHQEFTVEADIRVLILGTFPGQTLWCAAVGTNLINLWATALVRGISQRLTIWEPAWFGVVATTIGDLADLARAQVHHVQVQAASFR
ncbi:hypothetical protein D3C80_998190 [compost metagenome]